MKISRKRSLAKTLTWRVIATATTFIFVLLYSKSWNLAFSAGLIDTLGKTMVYYFHERGWQRISWGKTYIKK